MEGFITIVSIIFGILSLVLFFKIWGACDDIKEIRKSISGNQQQCNNISHNTAHSDNTPGNTPIAESIYGEEIWKLENRLSKCQSDRDRLDYLDAFLRKKSSELKKYTLKGNESAAMNNWAALIEWATPIYETLGSDIPEEYKYFTL